MCVVRLARFLAIGYNSDQTINHHLRANLLLIRLLYSKLRSTIMHFFCIHHHKCSPVWLHNVRAFRRRHPEIAAESSFRRQLMLSTVSALLASSAPDYDSFFFLSPRKLQLQKVFSNIPCKARRKMNRRNWIRKRYVNYALNCSHPLTPHWQPVSATWRRAVGSFGRQA